MKIGLTVHVVTENHTWPAHRKISIKSKPACLGKISGNNNSRMHNCLAKTVHKFTWSHPHHWSLQEFLSAPFQMLPRPCFGLVAYTCLQKLKIQDRACKPLLATNQTPERLQSHLEFFPLHCIPFLFPLSHSPCNHCRKRMSINLLLQGKQKESILDWKMCQKT